MASKRLRSTTFGWGFGHTWQAYLVGLFFAALLGGGALLIEPDEYPLEFVLYALVLCAGIIGLGLARGQSAQS